MTRPIGTCHSSRKFRAGNLLFPIELASLIKFRAAASAGIVEKGQLDAAIESPPDIPFEHALRVMQVPHDLVAVSRALVQASCCLVARQPPGALHVSRAGPIGTGRGGTD